MILAKGLAGLLTVAFLLGFAGSAGASVPTMTISEMTEASDTIVHGEVLSLVPHWDEQGGMIYTTVTVAPIGYMKGVPGGGEIEFEMPGGVVGEVGLAVCDVPEFKVGEEVVLFLRAEYFQVVGWRQGKLNVVDGMVSGQNMKVDQFRAHIAGLSGLSGSLDETRGEDGAVIRPAEFAAPPGAAGRTRAADDAGPGPEPDPNAEVTIMTEDFEGAFPTGAWSRIDQNGTGHQWGKDTYRVYGGSYSMWECADGASALPSGSNYADGMKTWAIYGPFDLSDANSAELNFWRSVQTADANDFIFWAASADGGSFSGFTANGGSGTWVQTTMDLASWIGDSTVWIAFMFQSDGSGSNKGVFIDDVEVKKTTPDASSPEITSISPSSGPSGAGFSVTINGSNFGATQGTSEVQFVWDPLDVPTVDADVVTSWSDTQIVCEVPERASSGMVHVRVNGDPGTGRNFTVTYGKSSTWWQTAEPMGEPMKVNPNCADEPAAQVLDCVIKGFQEWNAEGGGDFSFTYGGATTATDELYNGSNEIGWGTTGGSLATNYSWFNPSTGAILENDIIFDDVAWTWSASGAAGEYDIQSVATHELGHCLRLMDLYGGADFGKTMYGRISTGQTTPRTIELYDEMGLQSFYGTKTLNITTRDLPPATTPIFYNEQIAAVGGSAPHTFTLGAGPGLPAGFSLSSSGVVSGYAQVSGTFYFNVKVTDNASETDSQVIKLLVDVAAPVALEGFSAAPVDEGVLVEWNLASESDLGDFYLHRSVGDRDGFYEVLNEEPLAAEGPMGRAFRFLDREVVDGTLYFYKLETREGESGTFFGPVSTVASLGGASALWLGQNRPNPFSPSQHGVTTISFSVPTPAHATIRVYDVAGRLVAVPLDAPVGAGVTDAAWDGTGRDGAAVPSGVYFYELLTDGIHSTRKMTLMR
jgi:hypothetical protein